MRADHIVACPEGYHTCPFLHIVVPITFKYRLPISVPKCGSNCYHLNEIILLQLMKSMLLAAKCKFVRCNCQCITKSNFSPVFLTFFKLKQTDMV